jgi:MFS superfamily sulfate permease-like transporter
MTNGDESTGSLCLNIGFVSIIVSSVACFFLSQSHLTIYGVSVLSIVYINMIRPNYDHQQICVVTFLAGFMQFVLWRLIHNFSDIFHYLPGKVHAGMVLGIGIIVLTKFFPLTV